MGGDAKERIKEYKWSIISTVVAFLIGIAMPHAKNISEYLLGYVDEDYKPCEATISIEDPQDNSVVAIKNNLLLIEGNVKQSGCCKAIFLIIEPLSGVRAKFVSDRIIIPKGQEYWRGWARLESVNGGRVRIRARICSNLDAYPEVGCIEQEQLGIPSNSITVTIMKEQ